MHAHAVMEGNSDQKWCAKYCKTGEVLYFYNTITKEQRWSTENCQTAECCQAQKSRTAPSPCCIKKSCQENRIERADHTYVKYCQTQLRQARKRPNVPDSSHSITSNKIKMGSYEVLSRETREREEEKQSAREGRSSQESKLPSFCLADIVKQVENTTFSRPSLSDTESSIESVSQIQLAPTPEEPRNIMISYEVGVPFGIYTRTSSNALGNNYSDGVTENPRSGDERKRVDNNNIKESHKGAVTDKIEETFVGQNVQALKVIDIDVKDGFAEENIQNTSDSISCTRTHTSLQEQHDVVSTSLNGRPCHTCGMLFSTRQNLLAHSLEHVRDKPPLAIRGYPHLTGVSSTQGSLYVHQPQNPFHAVCPSCKKGFKTLIKFSKHFTISPSCSSTPHRCPLCSKTFIRRERFTWHLATHSYLGDISASNGLYLVFSDFTY